MKRIYALFLSAALLTGCAGTATQNSSGSVSPAARDANFASQPAASEQPGAKLSLVEAIDQSAQKIKGELPPGSRVAVVSFTSDNENLSDYLMEELIGALFELGFEVTDRQTIEQVYREFNFQMSGAVDDATIQEAGKFLGADMTITGELIDVGGAYRYRTSAVHQKLGTRASVTRATIRDNEEIQRLIAALANRKSTTKTATYGEGE
jgi:PBP1b-binding outer membrane lipoprotein LpoB